MNEILLKSADNTCIGMLELDMLQLSNLFEFSEAEEHSSSNKDQLPIARYTF